MTLSKAELPGISGRLRVGVDQLQLIGNPEGAAMSITVCVVCRESAEKAFPVGSFDEFKCPNCGYYSVNRQLLEEMAAAKQTFDTERTQQYLKTRLRSDPVPAISRAEAAEHELIAANERNR
jgi:hypothetical protein